MKALQTSFKRIEIKYLITRDQMNALLMMLSGSISADQYPESFINNIYYDTDDFRLIRSSLDKPVYKEKLRLRTYGTPQDHTEAFVEIKKKYDGIVYKRRLTDDYYAAFSTLSSGGTFASDTQIKREINCFIDHYGSLKAKMVISYHRLSFIGTNDPQLRITFDDNICYRTDDLDLRLGGDGKSLLDKDMVLMEVKTAGAVPLELARAMSTLGIRKSSFSKYGKAYIDYKFAEKRPMRRGSYLTIDAPALDTSITHTSFRKGDRAYA